VIPLLPDSISIDNKNFNDYYSSQKLIIHSPPKSAPHNFHKNEFSLPQNVRMQKIFGKILFLQSEKGKIIAMDDDNKEGNC
jgi:hypothetical protein